MRTIGVAEHNARREVSNVINKMTRFQVETMIFKWRYISPAQEFRIGSIPLFAADTTRTSVHFLENVCCSSGEGPKQVQHTLYEGELATNTAEAEW